MNGRKSAKGVKPMTCGKNVMAPKRTWRGSADDVDVDVDADSGGGGEKGEAEG